MSGLKVVQKQYAGHWPIWCILDGDRVLMCRETEQEAKQELERLRGDL